ALLAACPGAQGTDTDTSTGTGTSTTTGSTTSEESSTSTSTAAPTEGTATTDDSGTSGDAPPPAPEVLTVLQDIVFYDGYAATVDEPIPDGVIRHNNALVATRFTEEMLAKI